MKIKGLTILLLLLYGFVTAQNQFINDSVFIVSDTLAKVDTTPFVINFGRIKIPFPKESFIHLPIKNRIISFQKHDDFKQYFFLIIQNFFSISVLLIHITKANINKLMSTVFNVNMLKQVALVEIKRNNFHLWSYFLINIILKIISFYIIAKILIFDINWVKLSFFVFLFFIAEVIVNKLIAYVFKDEKIYAIIFFNHATFDMMSLPILLFSLLFLTYLPHQFILLFIILFLIVLIGLYIWKEFRNIAIMYTEKINIFSLHFFIYLCTFKMIPIAIFSKLILAEWIK